MIITEILKTLLIHRPVISNNTYEHLDYISLGLLSVLWTEFFQAGALCSIVRPQNLAKVIE